MRACGYTVRSTVRNPSLEEDIRGAVETQTDAGDRLSIIQADLLSGTRWAPAARDCDCIVHLASAIPKNAFESQHSIFLERALTRKVLEVGIREGVRRVVITSSIEAVSQGRGNNGIPSVDESSPTDIFGHDMSDYIRAKTLSERDAWELIEKRGSSTTLTTILPASVLGAELSLRRGQDPSALTALIDLMLKGELYRLPQRGFHIADVRDLVDLYIRALEMEEAAGQRFVATNGFLWAKEIASILRDLGPFAANVPTRTWPYPVARLLSLGRRDRWRSPWNVGAHPDLRPTKAVGLLGWSPRPPSSAVIDSALMR